MTDPKFAAAPHVGAWGYVAGVDGTATLPDGARVVQISAVGDDGAFTIDGGASIAASLGPLVPSGALIEPAIVFTGTTAYFVGYVID